MKKAIIYSLLFIILLSSCSRSARQTGSYCYSCQITGMGTNRTLDTCSNVPSSQYSFKDANGNTLSFFCQDK